MGLLDGIFDKESMVEGIIENALEKFSQELQCSPTELFLMIKPIRKVFSEDEKEKNFKSWLYQLKEGVPTVVREVTLKEILED